MFFYEEAILQKVRVDLEPLPETATVSQRIMRRIWETVLAVLYVADENGYPCPWTVTMIDAHRVPLCQPLVYDGEEGSQLKWAVGMKAKLPLQITLTAADESEVRWHINPVISQ